MSRTAWIAPLAVLLAIGVIVALAFYVRGFQSTGHDPVGLPGGSSPSAGAPVSSAHQHKSGKHSKKHGKHGGHGKSETSTPSGGTTVDVGGGSGLTITGEHTLVARVTSAAPIGEIGYLAPTSPDISYGTAKNVGKSWTVHTTVTGKPKYAIIWIYAGKSGTPVTCSISIDGKVRSHETTSGPYGRQICYA